MRARAGLAALLSLVAAGAVACGGHPAQVRLMARTRTAGPAASVLAGAPAAVAAGAAQRLFAVAPVAVLAGSGRSAELAAARQAQRAHAPLLLGPVTRTDRAALRALRTRTVLVVGLPAKTVTAALPGITVVTQRAQLPRVTAPAPLARVALLLHQRPSAGGLAAAATARAAGARVVALRRPDPRADPAAITALAAARPRQVLAVGSGFGPARRLAARVAVAETGVQLPGGGQLVVPMHRLVALYGHPGAPSLGALGEQDLAASIARVRRAAAPYRALSKVPVVPAFELIATVAQAHAGPDGSYSYESPLSLLRPWVQAATRAHMFVVLDLQPGRANFLAQARKYRSLLRRPNVGLALDPEWKLTPTELPLQQIGGVNISEVNQVLAWLSRLTARYHLPQKLVVLHQFRLSMLLDEQHLDTHHDNLAIVIHMDGQGSPGAKEATWDAVLHAAPRGVYFGWKDFYVKDHPMLDPRQTMDHSPQPVMISYQ
jgi:hypothetical protein